MFEDPELQDPLSLSLNENYDDQNSPHHDSKKAPASPEYNCETPEIQVIIKEEEEGWTVSENHESFSSEGEKEDASTHTCHPHVNACGKESSISYEVKRHERVYSVEKCSEESGGPILYGQSSSAREGRQRHAIMDSDEKLKISYTCGKTPGNVTVHQCNNTVREMTPGHKRNVKSHQRTHAVEECCAQDQSLDVKESTSLPTEADRHETKRSAPCQTDSPEHKPLMSHGLKMASANLEDQTLHLTVRLQAGDQEEEEEEQEEEQDEEIGGLINSDGEVIEWDAGDSSDQGSDCTESPQPSKGVVLSECQPQGQSQRDSSSPTLIMEVVSVGEDEEREEGEEKERVVKMAAVSSVYRGKRLRRKKKAAEVTVVSVDVSDTEKEVPASPVKKRAKRKTSEVPLMSAEDLEAEPGISRRTRRRRNAPIVESEELIPKTVRRAAVKRPYRRRRDAKQSAEGERESTGASAGRKGSVDLDDEVNPIASELSEYLKSLPGESKIRSSLRCLECGKECDSFHTASSLKLHEMQHSGERPFACTICGKTFRINSYLTAHYQTHIKDRPFICSVCGKGYSRAEELKVHHRLHTGERPYECGDCGKSFIYRQGLRQHQRTHAGRRIGPTRQLGRPKQEARLDI
ncbi:Zinc finger protein 717 [Collichthys lucidus]|uniref:Zinc finger protein 717 n=1 Tax=Collichthys lucidus TaxID=240159 RepID=A0A4U5U422_COLLU|nr:Zinc finger protein 717 [Collichthys lucidus]